MQFSVADIFEFHLLDQILDYLQNLMFSFYLID